MNTVQMTEDQCRLALESASLGLLDWDLISGEIVCDPRCHEILGLPPESKLKFSSAMERVHQRDRSVVEAALKRVLDPQGNGQFDMEFRIVQPDGRQRWVKASGAVHFDGSDSHKRATRYAGFLQDISQRKRNDAILAYEKQAFERIVQSAPLADVLELLTGAIEELCGDGMLASILLLDPDGVHLRHGAAPSLPASYISAIDGLVIGPAAGSCGTAAYRGETVMVNDIATDPLWDRYRDLALGYGLRSCWSKPILSAGGKVLATFALYYRAPRDARPEDLELVEILTRTATIAIERTCVEATLKTRNLRLVILSEAIEQLLGSQDPDLVVRELFFKAASQMQLDTYFHYIMNPGGGALSLRSYAGIPEPAAQRIRRLNFGQGIGGRVAETLQPIIASDIQHSDDTRVKLVRSLGIQAYACYPLISGGRLLGTLSFASRNRPRFGDEDLKFIESISRCVAVAMARTEIEQGLRESAEEFRALFERAGIGKAEIECATGRFLRVNPRLCDMFGYSAEELSRMTLFDVTHHDDHAMSRAAMVKLTQGEAAQATVEKRYISKDGAVVWGHVNATVFKSAEGKATRFLTDIQDVTRRRRAEEELQRLNQALEEKVKERTAEVRRAIAELLKQLSETERLQAQLLQAQKMESIGTLAGGIAHDFNNLLNIILGYATLVPGSITDPSKVSENIAVIKETVQRGGTLVQQLLAMTRKAEIKFEPVDINGLVRKLKDLLNETLPKSIDVNLGLEPDLPALLADPNQIDQVMINLCVNARDAMPDGGELRLTTAMISGTDLRTRFQEAREESYVRISVTDTGSGMDENTKSRLFEPFFTTKEQGRGTGLGLSVVYGIIGNHAGFVDVASEPGHGSTFRIYLPVSHEPTNAKEVKQENSGSEAQNFSARGETILFVEDEPRQLCLMQNFLEGEGYRVLIAKDGAEAVQTHFDHKEEIALVVLDLGLPKLDGWNAFQQMRQSDPRLKGIIATGHISPQIAEELTKGELLGVIMKPYQLDTVLREVTEAIHNPLGPVADELGFRAYPALPVRHQ